MSDASAPEEDAPSAEAGADVDAGNEPSTLDGSGDDGLDRDDASEDEVDAFGELCAAFGRRVGRVARWAAGVGGCAPRRALYARHRRDPPSDALDGLLADLLDVIVEHEPRGFQALAADGAFWDVVTEIQTLRPAEVGAGASVGGTDDAAAPSGDDKRKGRATAPTGKTEESPAKGSTKARGGERARGGKKKDGGVDEGDSAEARSDEVPDSEPKEDSDDGDE